MVVVFQNFNYNFDKLFSVFISQIEYLNAIVKMFYTSLKLVYIQDPFNYSTQAH